MTKKQPENSQDAEYDEKIAKMDWIVSIATNSVSFNQNLTNNNNNFTQIRPCSFYKTELKECKRIKGRFNQYFIYGEFLDCIPWKTDYKNCQKWSWGKDKKAASDLIDRELQRQDERLRAHAANNVWTKRDKPPEDWSKPLPEFIQKRNENTLLAFRAKELQEQEDAKEAAENETPSSRASKEERGFCSIMQIVM